MTNVGVYPFPADDMIAQFRILAGDSEPGLIDADNGTAEFSLWGDSDIAAYLSMEPENVYRAIALGYRALAGNAATQSKMVKDYDLEVDLTRRAGHLLKVAEEFDAKADRYDEDQNLRGDFFVWIEPNPIITEHAEASPYDLFLP